MRGSRLLRLLLLSVNFMLICGLGLSLIAPYIDPNNALFVAFFGLGFLPILLFNLGFVVFWSIMRPKYALFGLVALVFSIPNIQNHFHLSGDSESDNSNSIKVMSYNVRLFDLYNWTNNKQTRNEILDYLSAEKADIICFQEYFRSIDPSYFNTHDTLIQVQPAVNVHEQFSAVINEGAHQFGIATFSKFPIVKRALIPLDTSANNVAIYTDLKIGSDTVRVFNLHLASVHISAMEKGISEHLERNDQQKQWDDLKILVRKLAGGYKKRARQALVIAKYIEESPYPAIVCADLNDTPGSFAYQTIGNSLSDSFKENGGGFGTSYIGYFPSLRIDYIMHSDEVENVSFITDPVQLSDHHPIIGEFTIKE